MNPPRPLRVAHVITRMIVGGAQENTLLNCLDLKQIYGDEVCLITGPSPGPEGELLGQGRGGDLKITLLPELIRSISPWHDFRALRALRRELAAFKPDVVHTHSAKGGILGRQAASDLRIPAIVHTVHGAPFHERQSRLTQWFYRTCERRAARQCDRLICVADAMRDLVVGAGVAKSDQCVTIYSGMQVEPFLDAARHRDEVRKRLGIADDRIVVGKIARLFELKGHDDLIAAAARLASDHPKLTFLLVGDGNLRASLESRIAQLGLTDRFVFTGLVPPETVPHYLGAMDILAHCSLREGLARALPQALIAGIPVISYDIDGAREVVLAEQTGILLKPRDIEGLVAAISRLAREPELRRRWGGEGRGRFSPIFRHEHMTARIRDLYCEILDGHPSEW